MRRVRGRALMALEDRICGRGCESRAIPFDSVDWTGDKISETTDVGGNGILKLDGWAVSACSGLSGR